LEGRYCRIKTKFWTDEKMRKRSDDAKLLALYLLSSPHANMIGCYVLPKLYACEDLGWSPQRFGKAFAELLQDGFVKYDEETRLLLIPNYLKHNPIENKNQAIAAAKVVIELPRSPLLQELKQFAEQLGKLFLEPFIEQLSKQIPEHITVTVNKDLDPSRDKSLDGQTPTEQFDQQFDQQLEGDKEAEEDTKEDKEAKQKDKWLVDEMKKYRQTQGIPPTERDWHLRQYAIIRKLRTKGGYTHEELHACFLDAQRDPYWSKQLDSWATIERYLPKWKLKNKARADPLDWIPFEPSETQQNKNLEEKPP